MKEILKIGDFMKDNDIIEKLAAYEHDRWSR